MPFTTPTGQTGRDAYVYEAIQIANAQRDLDLRMRRLCKAIHEEAPHLFSYSTDFHPELGIGAKSAHKLVNYILKTGDYAPKES